MTNSTSDKKPNVFLETHSLDHIYREPCGYWSIDKMNKFLQQIQGSKIPHTSCMFGMSATLQQTARISRIQNMDFGFLKINIPADEKSLVISVNMDCVDKPCNTPDIQGCLKRIATNQCKDKFTIETLVNPLILAKNNQKEQ